MARGFNAGSFLGRWVFAAALVFGTYNPTDYSYLSWVFSANATFGPVLALVGVLLLIGWIIFLRATFMSMGWLGIILGAAFFSCLIWLLVDLGWLNINAPGTISWLALLLLSLTSLLRVAALRCRRSHRSRVTVRL